MEKLYRLFNPQDEDAKHRLPMWVILIGMFIFNAGWVQVISRAFSFKMELESIFIGGKFISPILQTLTLENDTLASIGLFWLIFIFACILAPLWEEYVFRLLFFVFGIKHRSEANRKRYMVHIIIGSSILFGVLHGSPFNIFIQGVGGLFLWYVFLRGGRHGYYWSVAAHALWNFSIISGFLF